MRAVVLDCTSECTPEHSNSELLANALIDALVEHDVAASVIRVIDHNVLPGILTDEGPGDGWPAIHDEILDSEILIIATPASEGQRASLARQVVERMDAMLSEIDSEGRPVAFNRVAGFAVTGSEDGDQDPIAELTHAVSDIGFTVPGWASTYLKLRPSSEDSDTDCGHEHWASMSRAAASNLVAVARALAATPIPAP